jgi:hypothetical protein
VDGFARSLREVLRDRDDHTVIDVGRQVKSAIEHLLSPVFVGLGVHAVLSGGSLQRDLGVLGKCGSALHQAVALHAKDALLSEHHSLVEYRSVLEAEYHAALDLCPPLNLEEIARCKESAVNIAKHKEAVRDAFDEAYRDRGRRGLVQPQQNHHQNQRAERRRASERYDGGDACPSGRLPALCHRLLWSPVQSTKHLKASAQPDFVVAIPEAEDST